MATPVWVLSVDLQTKSAVFQTGLAEAARSARGSFGDIGAGARQMGNEVREGSRAASYSMMEARHSVMIMGEEVGIHLPRALTSFIASLGPLGAALEAAFPFLAVILGATLLIEHLTKLREEASKLTDSQANMGTTIQGVFNKLDDKLLEVGIKTDELSGNHLAALRKQLELIDHQDLKALIDEFGTLDKVAVAVLTQVKAHWYEFGSGSTGPAHALEEFKTKYESLLSLGKNKEAGDLLAGTLASSEKVLALQKQAADNQSVSGGKWGDYAKYEQASLQLKQMGIGFTEKEVQAQETLTDALRAQVTVAEKIAAIGSGEKKNASDAESKRAAMVSEEDAKKAQKIFAEIAKAHKDLSDALEKDANEVARVNAFELEDGLKQEKKATEEKLKIFDESARIEEALGKEQAEHIRKSAELRFQAEESAQKDEVKLRKQHSAEILAAEIASEDERYRAQIQADETELEKLDKFGKDYAVKLKKLHDDEDEETQKHANNIARITLTSQQERNKAIEDADMKLASSFARNMAQTLTGHQTFAKMITSLGNEVVMGAIQNALMLETVDGRKRLSKARTAASEAYQWGWEHGGPVAPALAIASGALAFTTAMAFSEGGMVPGIGRGDIVPAMLTPGEAVIPKNIMDGLSEAAKHGGMNNSDRAPSVTHKHTHEWNINAFDSHGFDRVLEKHGGALEKHVENTFRKRNM